MSDHTFGYPTVVPRCGMTISGHSFSVSGTEGSGAATTPQRHRADPDAAPSSASREAIARATSGGGRLLR